jgi:hypothetical protein
VRKGEQTRLEIIRKAAPIFNQNGYVGAALSDLMTFAQHCRTSRKVGAKATRFNNGDLNA